jgi:TetR/AcrR family transcriptional regulator, cholesterol catabolism regulator
MARAARNSQEFHETRAAIIRAAAAVFARQGFHAGTTKDIAVQVGLSQPSIYYYFGSKETLLEELILQLLADLKSALVRSRESSVEPKGQMQAFVRNFAATIAEDVELCEVFWSERPRLPKRLADAANAGEREYVEYTKELVRQLQEQGELDAGSDAVVAQAILGMVLWMSRWYGRIGPRDSEQVASVFLQLIGLHEKP